MSGVLWIDSILIGSTVCVTILSAYMIMGALRFRKRKQELREKNETSFLVFNKDLFFLKFHERPQLNTTVRDSRKEGCIAFIRENQPCSKGSRESQLKSL